MSYSSAEIKFININSKTDGCEITHLSDYEKQIDKKRAIDLLDRMVFKAQQDLLELENKRKYFIDKFEKHFNLIDNQSNHLGNIE